MKLNIRKISGIDVGVSLAFSQLAAHHVLTPQLFCTDLAISHAVYGRDRLLDQIDGSDEKSPVGFVLSTSIAMLASFFGVIHIGHTECVPAITALSLSYKDIKPFLKEYKPLFIGLLWSYAITVLPAHDLNVPLFSFYTLLYTATSSLADHKDEIEDKKIGVETVIVKYGKESSYTVSAVLSSAAIGAHSFIDSWTWGDYFTQCVSIGIVLLCSIGSVDDSFLDSFNTTGSV